MKVLTLWSRRRANLAGIGRAEHGRYMVTEQPDGTLILSPVEVVPAESHQHFYYLWADDAWWCVCGQVGDPRVPSASSVAGESADTQDGGVDGAGYQTHRLAGGGDTSPSAPPVTSEVDAFYDALERGEDVLNDHIDPALLAPPKANAPVPDESETGA